MRLLQFRRRAPGRSRLGIFFYWTFIATLVRTFFRVVYRARYRGRRNVPSTGPLVYVANHQSHFDPPFVGSAVMDRPFASMARATLFDFAPFAWLLRAVGAVALSRGGRGDKAALTVALKELKAGRCVLIFPEGTRSRNGALGKFHRGFLMLVKRSGAAVVPVAVEGAFDAWPITRRRPKIRGRLAVQVGEPFEAADIMALDADEAIERIKRRIEEMRLQLRDDLRARTRGRIPAPGPGDRPYWERAAETPAQAHA